MITTSTTYALFIVMTMATSLGPIETWERIHTFTGPNAFQLCRANGMRIAERRNADSGRKAGPYRAHCEWLEVEGGP